MVKSKHLYKIVLLLFYIFVAAAIISLIRAPSLIDKRLGAIPLMNFDAYKPFQYRALVPILVNGVYIITPQFVIDKIESAIRPRLESKAEICTDPELQAKYYIISENVVRVIIFYIFNFIAMLGFLLVIRKLLLHLDFLPSRIANILPASFIFIMPIFYEYPNFIYDFMHLFLFTAGLYMLYLRKWHYYLIVFALAILNKETAIMLTVIYAFAFFKDLELKRYLILLGWQAAIFILIKIALLLVFRDNPGDVVEFHIDWNSRHLADWHSYFRFEPLDAGLFLPSRINILYPRGVNLPLIAAVFFLSAYGWRSKPLLIRQSTIYFPILIIMAFTMGLIFELRAYYDVVPITFILSIMGLTKLIKDIKTKLAGG